MIWIHREKLTNIGLQLQYKLVHALIKKQRILDKIQFTLERRGRDFKDFEKEVQVTSRKTNLTLKVEKKKKKKTTATSTTRCHVKRLQFSTNS